MIIKLPFHRAKFTQARTYWKVELPSGDRLSLQEAEAFEVIKLLYSNKDPKKTHWVEYYEVRNPIITLVRCRISNRGNFSALHYRPEQLEVSVEELEALRCVR